MNKYTIEITESVSKLIDIQAEDLDDAITKVKEKYQNGEIELTDDDEIEVRFDKYKG